MSLHPPLSFLPPPPPLSLLPPNSLPPPSSTVTSQTAPDGVGVRNKAASSNIKETSVSPPPASSSAPGPTPGSTTLMENEQRQRGGAPVQSVISTCRNGQFRDSFFQWEQTHTANRGRHLYTVIQTIVQYSTVMYSTVHYRLYNTLH